MSNPDDSRPLPPLHTHRRASDPREPPCDVHDEAIETLQLHVARLDRKDAQQQEQILSLRRDVDRLERKAEDTGKHDLSATQRELERFKDAERVRLADEKAAPAHLLAAQHAKADTALAVRSNRLWDVAKSVGTWALPAAIAGGFASKASAFVQWLADLFRHGPPKGH